LYGYRMLVIPPNETVPLPDAGQWQADTFPGGLYAMSSTAADSAATIIGAWNRLFSEWLPASRFERREGPFVEEFIQYKGKIARMHLYAPICRGTDQPFIRIVSVGRRQIVFTRSYGPGAYEEADGRLTRWIRSSGCLEGLAECSYYMSYDNASGENGRNWWEAGIGCKGSIRLDDGMDTKELGGGEYVCLTTETYGMLKGVLHRLERWLEHQEDYEPDVDREWFAEYVVRKDSSPECMRVTCYLPVRLVRAVSGQTNSDC
jgi:DNA gyrase inhibitor GyrI